MIGGLTLTNSLPRFVQEPTTFYILPGQVETYLIGNIVDDENDPFSYEGESIEFNWIELNIENPTLPYMTISPPTDIYDYQENPE